MFRWHINTNVMGNYLLLCFRRSQKMPQLNWIIMGDGLIGLLRENKQKKEKIPLSDAALTKCWTLGLQEFGFKLKAFVLPPSTAAANISAPSLLFPYVNEKSNFVLFLILILKFHAFLSRFLGLFSQ